VLRSEMHFVRCNLSGFVNVILITAQYAPFAAR
jgi:hypothetical protein